MSENLQQILTPWNLFCASLFVLGVKKILSLDGLFFFFNYITEAYIAEALYKKQTFAAEFLRYVSRPFYYCFPCMASLWGFTYLYLITIDLILVRWGLFLVVLCGANVIIGSLLEGIQGNKLKKT